MSIEEMRANHHLQARLLAEGREVDEVAAIVGKTASQLESLLDDPTFRELMAYYRGGGTYKPNKPD